MTARTLSDLVERLRSSAKAFRKHPIYNQDGDGCYLTVQAEECDQAAAILQRILDPSDEDVEMVARLLSEQAEMGWDKENALVRGSFIKDTRAIFSRIAEMLETRP